MKVKLLFLVILILVPLTSQGAFRYNQESSCGPINYCVEGNGSENKENCLALLSQCAGQGADVSVCYWVDSCQGQTPNPGTIGPLNPPLQTDFCVQNPSLCQNGEPNPCALNPNDPTCPDDEDLSFGGREGRDWTYQPPQPYNIDESLENPLESDTVLEVINKIYDWVMAIVIPVLVVVLVYTGLQFVLAQGNEEKVKRAKNTATYVFVGIVIILAANIVLELITNLLNTFNQ